MCCFSKIYHGRILFAYFVEYFIDLLPMNLLDHFISNKLKAFNQDFLYHTVFLNFHKHVLELTNINILDLILWDINMHYRGWIVIWLVTYFRNNIITFLVRRVLTSIKGDKIRQSVLIKVLSIFNIFHITENYWFPITIVTLIQTILYFL